MSLKVFPRNLFCNVYTGMPCVPGKGHLGIYYATVWKHCNNIIKLNVESNVCKNLSDVFVRHRLGQDIKSHLERAGCGGTHLYAQNSGGRGSQV